MPESVVFISGVWDLFHTGHLRILQRAKELGDFLLVGVCSDEFAQTYKSKPIIPYEQRAEVVYNLRYVDDIVKHQVADQVDHIQEWGVTTRVVGPEFGKLDGQRRFLKWAKEHNIRIVTLPRTPDISTTIIKEKIKNG